MFFLDMKLHSVGQISLKANSCSEVASGSWHGLILFKNHVALQRWRHQYLSKQVQSYQLL